MLHIIVWILKIIAILLLSILGVILILLLTILFVPLRYRAEGTYFGKPEGRLRFTWLLHILTVQLTYEGEKFTSGIKLFGIPLKKREKKEKRHRRKKPEGNQNSRDSRNPESGKANDTCIEETKEEQEEKQEVKAAKEMETAAKAEDKQGIEVKDPADTKADGQEKAKALLKKLKSIWKKITGIPDRIRAALKKKDAFLAFIRDADTKAAFLLVKSQFFRLLLHLKPQKLSIRLRFGFEDPAVTGQVLGLLCILYGWYRKTIVLEPDFENKILEGDFYLQGRIRGLNLLIIGIKVYRDKSFRKIINSFMHKED